MQTLSVPENAAGYAAYRAATDQLLEGAHAGEAAFEQGLPLTACPLVDGKPRAGWQAGWKAAARWHGFSPDGPGWFGESLADALTAQEPQ